uniref:Uncharacterized protein n=1 Tax=Coccolithus braarudii TaxID=221442 RepID=A0A7S0LBB9_9EUKA
MITADFRSCKIGKVEVLLCSHTLQNVLGSLDGLIAFRCNLCCGAYAVISEEEHELRIHLYGRGCVKRSLPLCHRIIELLLLCFSLCFLLLFPNTLFFPAKW